MSNRTKPVIQCSLDGKLMGRYNSIREASQNVFISPQVISLCCHKERNTAGGFKWKFEGDATDFKHSDGRGKPKGIGRQVIQYKDGIKINEYQTISEASKIVGINASSISKCCRNKAKRVGGYEWRYKNEPSTNK